VIDDGQGRAVKRLIGLPGERIRLSEGRVLVNNFVLYEPYLPASALTTPSARGSDFDLGQEEYFVLGDNRAESLDSRDYGPIKNSSIIGAVDVDRHQPIRYLFQPQGLVLAQGRREAATPANRAQR
jgi:signal peptidase I